MRAEQNREQDDRDDDVAAARPHRAGYRQ